MKLVFLLVGFLATMSHAQVTWEVRNRFPLLSAPSFERLTAVVGDNREGLELRISATDLRNVVRHLSHTGGPEEIGPAWDSDKQLYVAARILKPTAEIVARAPWPDEKCSWVLKQASAPSRLLADSECVRSPTFDVELNKEYTLEARRLANGTLLPPVTVLARPRLIVAVGDSFASGEGNPDYPADFTGSKEPPPFDWMLGSRFKGSGVRIKSAEWLDLACHRSLLAWPSLYALREAITKKDTVVQFASFACSGAEVLDGFLLKQKNPTGETKTTLKNATSTYLLRPQQEAMAEFLCEGTQRPESVTVNPNLVTAYFQKYGQTGNKVQIFKCDKPRYPDEILLLFGGNDSKFAGVVRYVFNPVYVYRWPQLGELVRTRMDKELEPVSPKKAEPYLKLLPETYKLLQTGLKPFLNPDTTARQSVTMVRYPDPDFHANIGSERDAELRLCKLRTQDGNRPIQVLVTKEMKFAENWSGWWGISGSGLEEVRQLYVNRLRNEQTTAAATHGWALHDSLDAFRERGLCAGTMACAADHKACPTADAVRWAAARDEFASQDAPIVAIKDFKAYDPSRARGFRYAYDALLTGARVDSSGNLLLDWVTNMAHPTAASHARLAEVLPSPGTGASTR